MYVDVHRQTQTNTHRFTTGTLSPTDGTVAASSQGPAAESGHTRGSGKTTSVMGGGWRGWRMGGTRGSFWGTEGMGGGCTCGTQQATGWKANGGRARFTARGPSPRKTARTRGSGRTVSSMDAACTHMLVAIALKASFEGANGTGAAYMSVPMATCMMESGSAEWRMDRDANQTARRGLRAIFSKANAMAMALKLQLMACTGTRAAGKSANAMGKESKRLLRARTKANSAWAGGTAKVWSSGWTVSVIKASIRYIMPYYCTSACLCISRWCCRQGSRGVVQVSAHAQCSRVRKGSRKDDSLRCRKQRHMLIIIHGVGPPYQGFQYAYYQVKVCSYRQCGIVAYST